MIEITERASDDAAVTATVTLPMEKRVKSRLRVTLDDGREAGIFLVRGESMQHGDKLLSTDGEAIEVKAAEETVSIVYCDDQLLFARACYHLGNRHVPVQIVASGVQPTGGSAPEHAAGAISYLHDHVLDDMLRGLGLTVQVISAPFSPEPGAYGGGHRHSHDDDDHDHSNHKH